MGKRCFKCKLWNYKKEAENLSFHSCPKNAESRNVWISVLLLDAVPNLPKQFYICSRHFQKSNFEEKNGKKFLKPGAVPMLVHKEFATSDSESSSSCYSENVNDNVQIQPTISMENRKIHDLITEKLESPPSEGFKRPNFCIFCKTSKNIEGQPCRL